MTEPLGAVTSDFGLLMQACSEEHDRDALLHVQVIA